MQAWALPFGARDAGGAGGAVGVCNARGIFESVKTPPKKILHKIIESKKNFFGTKKNIKILKKK